MRLLQTLRMGHNNNNYYRRPYKHPALYGVFWLSLFFDLPSILLDNLFMILYHQVGPWPAVGRKPLNTIVFS